MSTPESRFLSTITKKAAAPFDEVEFFRGASFARAVDLRPAKLADALGTPLTTPGVKPPKIETPLRMGLRWTCCRAGSRRRPRTTRLFHGSAAPGDAGNGFNPSK